MKRLLIVIPLVFLFCIIFGCQQVEEVPVEPVAVVEADIQAIKDILTNMLAASNSADLEKLVSFCADDMIRIFPNQPAVIGKEAYRSGFKEFFDQFNLQEENVIENIIISGDFAVAHVTFSAIITPKGVGEPTELEIKGNWLLVFKRQLENAWKVIYSISSDESLISPIPEGWERSIL